MVKINRHLFPKLADLFGYPGEVNIVQRASEILDNSDQLKSPCYEELKKFRDAITDLDGHGIEELYIGTFDVASETCPYVGYLVFGDSFKRGEFLVGLKGTFKECGFTDDSDLPDHIAVLLRFIGHAGIENQEVVDLVRFAIHPALKKAIGAMENNPNPNPYIHLLNAVVAMMHTIAESAEIVQEVAK